MINTDPISAISMLTKRERVLRAVGTTGCGKRELVDSLSVSRSTIDRSIRELESAGLLTRSSQGYHRTLFGELLLEEYETFESRTRDILSGQEVLSELPPELDLDTVILKDADIVTATRYAPHQPISALCSLLREARWIQTVFPAVFPQVVETWATITDDEALRADIVVTEPVVSELVSGHSETLQRLLENSRIALHQVPERPAYGLVIAEEEDGATAGVVILNDNGARALISTDTPAAVSWIRERIDHNLNRSTPLSSLSADHET